jgi:hypothetical protein
MSNSHRRKINDITITLTKKMIMEMNSQIFVWVNIFVLSRCSVI